MFYTRNMAFRKIFSKNQNCHIKQKFGTYTNLNMQNSIWVFTFFILVQKYCFWTNLVQRMKIVAAS